MASEPFVSATAKALGETFILDVYENSVLKELMKVKVTLTEMMRDRGYRISRKDEWLLDPSLTFTQFYQRYEQAIVGENNNFLEMLEEIYVQDYDPKGEMTTKIFFPSTPFSGGQKRAIGIDRMSPILKQMQDLKIYRAIIVSEEKLSSKGMEQLTKYPSWVLQHFTYDELSYNVTKHFLVPPHRLMSLEEMTQFLAKNKNNLADLPGMSFQDPIVRYYGASIGDIFEIERFDIVGTTMVSKSLAHRTVRDIPLEMPPQKKV